MRIVVVGYRSVATVVQQRSVGQIGAGRWEFPGGKVEEDEDPRAALSREWLEEVGLIVTVGRLLDARIMEFTIGRTLILLYEVFGNGRPAGLEGQTVMIKQQAASWEPYGNS